MSFQHNPQVALAAEDQAVPFPHSSDEEFRNLQDQKIFRRTTLDQTDYCDLYKEEFTKQRNKSLSRSVSPRRFRVIDYNNIDEEKITNNDSNKNDNEEGMCIDEDENAIDRIENSNLLLNKIATGMIKSDIKENKSDKEQNNKSVRNNLKNSSRQNKELVIENKDEFKKEGKLIKKKEEVEINGNTVEVSNITSESILSQISNGLILSLNILNYLFSTIFSVFFKTISPFLVPIGTSLLILMVAIQLSFTIANGIVDKYCYSIDYNTPNNDYVFKHSLLTSPLSWSICSAAIKVVGSNHGRNFENSSFYSMFDVVNNIFVKSPTSKLAPSTWCNFIEEDPSYMERLTCKLLWGITEDDIIDKEIFSDDDLKDISDTIAQVAMTSVDQGEQVLNSMNSMLTPMQLTKRTIGIEKIGYHILYQSNFYNRQKIMDNLGSVQGGLDVLISHVVELNGDSKSFINYIIDSTEKIEQKSSDLVLRNISPKELLDTVDNILENIDKQLDILILTSVDAETDVVSIQGNLGSVKRMLSEERSNIEAKSSRLLSEEKGLMWVIEVIKSMSGTSNKLSRREEKQLKIDIKVFEGAHSTIEEISSVLRTFKTEVLQFRKAIRNLRSSLHDTLFAEIKLIEQNSINAPKNKNGMKNKYYKSNSKIISLSKQSDEYDTESEQDDYEETEEETSRKASAIASLLHGKLQSLRDRAFKTVI